MSNDSTSHSKQKQDYRKDTLCTADIFEEKDCAGFKSMAGSGTCLHQGLDFACEAVGKDNAEISRSAAIGWIDEVMYWINYVRKLLL